MTEQDDEAMPSPDHSGVPPRWDDAELASRLMHGEDAAILELNARYGPLLLRQAKRRGLGPAERRELVAEMLTDVTLHLMTPEAKAPLRLRGYLVATLDRRLIDRRRRELSAPELVELADVEDEVATPADTAATEPSDEASAASAAHALAVTLRQAMDDADRELLLWIGERIPQRVIAEWLEMTDGALRTYVSRLRRRLREVARSHVATLPERERSALAHYFERFPAVGSAAAHHRPGPAPTRRRHGTRT